MQKFKLINGNEKISFEKREAQANKLNEEIQSRDFISDRDHFVYAYHWMCLGFPASAKTHLYRIQLKYFTTDVFKDLYRSLLAELLMRTERSTPEMEREFEFFIVVKRGVKMFPELDLSHLTKKAIQDLAEQFDTYSRF